MKIGARVLRESFKKSSIYGWGSDFPSLIKLNSEDFLEGGLTLEDSLKIGTLLQEEGSMP